MEKEKIAERLSSLLPNRASNPGEARTREAAIEQGATSIKAKQDAKELAMIKYKEKQRLKAMQQKEEQREKLAAELGISAEEIPAGQTEHQTRAIAEQQKRVEIIEAIEAEAVEPLSPVEIAQKSHTYSSKTTEALRLQGPSRAEITKLLTNLNINLSVQLTKQDTANLLACLLTCTESQLQALMSNKKVPIVIKAVIKRLLEDTKLGNIETVERLWDRVFGKGQMQLDLPESTQLQTGILPSVPISREAYVIIRDTLIK